MNHQPFETWLFSEEPLPLEHNRTLYEHLQECDHCRQLQSAWRGVNQSLQAAPMVAPVSGFATRWQARLNEQKKARQKKQSLILLASMFGIASLLLIMLVLLATQMLSSSQEILFGWIYRLVTAYAFLEAAKIVATSIVPTFIRFVPLPVWVLILGALSMFSVLWLAAYKQLLSPRRVIL
jgi:predicted anti-sigma-YlaC factor YlaD